MTGNMYAIKEKNSELYLTANKLWAHRSYRCLFNTRTEAADFLGSVEGPASMSPAEIVRVRQ